MTKRSCHAGWYVAIPLIMKKNYENMEIMRNNNEIKLNKFHSMKVIYEKAIGVNDVLELNVDEQQVEIKFLRNNVT